MRENVASGIGSFPAGVPEPALLGGARYYAAMKTNFFPIGVIALVGTLGFTTGCNRQSRGNADAETQSRAAGPSEGGATTTSGSAGQAKNFGDTSRSGAHGGVTNPETPKQTNTPESNRPEKQPPPPTTDK